MKIRLNWRRFTSFLKRIRGNKAKAVLADHHTRGKLARAAAPARTTLGRFDRGFIEEFGDPEQARKHFNNLVCYANESRPAFRFAVQLASGTLRSDLGDEQLTWVLLLYASNKDWGFDPFYLSFQESPLYGAHGFDNYQFTAYRRATYTEGLAKGTMQVLDEFRSPATWSKRTREEFPASGHRAYLIPLWNTEAWPSSEMKDLAAKLRGELGCPVKLLKAVRVQGEFPTAADTYVVATALLACESAGVDLDVEPNKISFRGGEYRPGVYIGSIWVEINSAK